MRWNDSCLHVILQCCSRCLGSPEIHSLNITWSWCWSCMADTCYSTHFFSQPVDGKQNTFFFSVCFASTLSIQDRARAPSYWPKFNLLWHQVAAVATETKQSLKKLTALLRCWPLSQVAQSCPVHLELCGSTCLHHRN